MSDAGVFKVKIMKMIKNALKPPGAETAVNNNVLSDTGLSVLALSADQYFIHYKLTTPLLMLLLMLFLVKRRLLLLLRLKLLVLLELFIMSDEAVSAPAIIVSMWGY